MFHFKLRLRPSVDGSAASPGAALRTGFLGDFPCFPG
jgi:hypothetical protein